MGVTREEGPELLQLNIHNMSTPWHTRAEVAESMKNEHPNAHTRRTWASSS
jgi:hypothetical protein